MACFLFRRDVGMIRLATSQIRRRAALVGLRTQMARRSHAAIDKSQLALPVCSFALVKTFRCEVGDVVDGEF
jgi:hypothetical protein